MSAIAVVDIGATNSKVIVFDQEFRELDSRKTATGHIDGPPYKHLDSDRLMGFLLETLTDFDAQNPIDTIAVSAFGATVACLDDAGQLVLPVMDYLAEAPPDVDAGYAGIAPPFSEVYSNVSPGALTIGKQLYWLETQYPDAFARTQGIVPFSAFIGQQLGGQPAMELSNLGVFTHLLDVKANEYSSLVKARGWESKFPPLKNAWDVIGRFKPDGFRGKGEILCGIHDSNANWLRYLAGHEGAFTLLSTGTFVIGFDSETALHQLDPNSDVFSFTDIFGKPVACSRFYGGYEFDALLEGVSPDLASAPVVAELVSNGVLPFPRSRIRAGQSPDAATGERSRAPSTRHPSAAPRWLRFMSP